jgi:PAS domain S-box-containing protein
MDAPHHQPPSSPRASPDPATAVELRLERVRLHGRGAPTSVLASLGAGAVTAGLSSAAIGARAASVWLVCLVAVLVFRLGVRQAQARAGDGDPARPGHWLTWHRLGFLLHGGVWTVLVVLLPGPAATPNLQPLLLIVTAMSGGALVAGAYDRVAGSLFSLPLGLVLIVRLLGVGAEPQPHLVPTVTIFLLMMVLVAGRASGMLTAEVQARVAQRRRGDEAEAARHALAQQVGLYRQLLDNTRQGFWHVDLEGRTIDLNPAMCRMLGRGREDVIGRKAQAFFTGDEAEVLAREIARRVDGVGGGYTVDIVRPDGTRLHAFNQATPIRDPSGGVIGSIGLWTDLTEVQRLERDLRIHEGVVGSITDAVAVVGPQRRYRLVNDAWSSSLGVPREGAVGQPADAAMASIGLLDATGSAALQACLSDGTVGTVTAVARWPDGRQTVVQTRLYPYRGADAGAPIEGAILVTRDITDRERDRAEVEIAAGYLRSTLDATGDAIFANDSDDPHEPVRFANQHVLELFGLTHLTPSTVTPAQILEAGVLLFRQGEAVRAEVGRMIAAGVRHDSQVEMTDGRMIFRRFEPAPVAGRMLRVWSFRDITAQHRALLALAAARDDAERANEAKSRFLSQMSHELRTPMNAVVGFAQLLLRDDRPALAAHQQEWSGRILQGAGHLLELINEVLDLGRIEAGHLTLAPVPVGLVPLVDECLALVRALAAERGVRLLPLATADGASGQWDVEPVVQADRLRLRQVLLNLLGNAIKYNRRDGEVQVHLVPYGDAWRITVRDTGHGISAQALPRLFQPFERLDADQGPVEGTGIGLALSRRLVEAMGGVIDVDSDAGRGSAFSVRLPALRDAKPTLPARRADPPAAWVVDDATSPSTADVLYIDDNEVNLLLVDAILTRAGGLTCHLVRDPLEGLAKAAVLRPDLILLDIQMPGLDGYGVLSRLRADPATAGIPVVAISADATSDDRSAARRAGFDAYLTKPVDVDGLLETVHRFAARTA